MLGTQGQARLGMVEGTGSNGRTADTVRAAEKAKPSSGARNHPQPRAKASQQSERELLSAVNEKLDRIVAVLAAQGRDRDTQVAILAAAGCDSSFVGTVVGMSPGAVRKLPAWRRSQGNIASQSQGEGTIPEGTP